MPMVLPLPAFAFQLLCLASSVAIDAFIFNRRGGMGRRQSVEHALVVELTVVCMGWLAFFAIHFTAASDLQRWIREFILLGVWSNALNIWALLIVSLSFFIALELKNIALNLLGVLLEEQSLVLKSSPEDTGQSRTIDRSLIETIPEETARQIGRLLQRYQRLRQTTTSEFVFLSHAWSSLAVLGISVLQFQAVVGQLVGEG